MLTLRPSDATVLLAAAVLLASCGQGAPDAAAPEADPAPPIPSPAPAPPLEPESAPVVTVQPAQPGVWNSGALTIRADPGNLRVTDERWRNMGLGLTLTFENASEQPVSIILARDGFPAVQLDNGLNMSPIRNNGTGILNQCGRDLDMCRQGERERFLEIEAGKTLSVVMTFGGEFPEGGRPELQTVDDGTLTLRLHVLDGEGLTRTLDVSLKNFVIQNRIN